MTGISAAHSGSKVNVSPSPKKNVDRSSYRAGRFLLAPNMSNSLEKYKKQFSMIKDISDSNRNIN